MEHKCERVVINIFLIKIITIKCLTSYFVARTYMMLYGGCFQGYNTMFVIYMYIITCIGV